MSDVRRLRAAALPQALRTWKRRQGQALAQQLPYAALAHADRRLPIAHHALVGVREHPGQSGHRAPLADAGTPRQAMEWLAAVRRLRGKSQARRATHPDEDLETARKALAIAEAWREATAARHG
ncbi:MAG TPA: hypothetical protein VKZ60_17360 [Chloroflexota bacterium]|nr:hypothetical protein [Chloroflexota bacterium]